MGRGATAGIGTKGRAATPLTAEQMIRAIDRLERQTNRELARRPQDRAAIIAREKKRLAGMMRRWGVSV